jgi:hypothetical protein
MRDEGTPSMDIAKSDVEPCSDRRLKRGHPDPWFMIAGDTPHSDSFDRTLAIQIFEFYFVRKWSRWHPQQRDLAMVRAKKRRWVTIT